MQKTIEAKREVLVQTSAGEPEESGLRTWLEIDQKAIAHNFSVFKKLAGNSKIMAVVKSNAYGHSLIKFSKKMEELGADWLGVDSVVEAVSLRKQGITKPILVLGYTLPERLQDAVQYDISVAVSTFEHLEKIESFGRKIKIHVKIDSGMHRQGFLPEDLQNVVAFLKRSKNTMLEGLFTHFSSAKNPAFPEFTRDQIKTFEAWRTAFQDGGFKFISHASATAGLLLFPEARFDLVRVGIGLYGLWPSGETESFFSGRLKLLPVLSWKTVISEMKTIKKGSKIGYDGTENLSSDTLIAVCPIGYWHGYPRALSSIGYVLVNGKRARVLGRVSMDMIVIDVTGIKGLQTGSKVTLLGTDGKESVSAKEIASLCDTSYYEIITRINPLIKRLYV